MTKVLVVDDQSVANIDVMFNALANNGYSCEIVDCKEDIVSKVIQFKPNIIFITANEASFDLCRELKTNVKTCYVKVYMFVETQDVNEVVKGFCLGAVDYIPLNTPEAEIVKHLEIKTSIEAMYEKVHTYGSTMKNIFSHNEARLQDLNAFNDI